MTGTKNLVAVLKAHIGSVSFVHGNMLQAFASLRVFFCNYVLSSLVLILRYIIRFQGRDRKSEHHVQQVLADQMKKNQFEESEIDGFVEKLVNFMFPCSEDFREFGEERDVETECSVFEEATISDFDVYKDSKSGEAATKTESSVLVETDSDTREACKESEGETVGSVFKETVSGPDGVHADVEKIDGKETECSVSMDDDSNVHQDGTKTKQAAEEEETEGSISMNTSCTTTSKYEFMSRKDISVFMEEPSTMTFSFRHYYTSASKEFSEGIVSQETEEPVLEQRSLTSNSYVHESLVHNDDPLEPASEPESSISSDGTVAYKNGEPNNESESIKMNEEGRVEDVEDVEETQLSSDGKVSHGFEDGEETMWEENLDLDGSYHEEDEDDLDWDDEEDDDDDDDDDDDELVQQMKLELRNAKQGGLATILEEEEGVEEAKEKTESPKVVGDLKPLKIEEKKLEYKDHMVEIQKFYKGYAEKMRKLDVLNYQTMHAIGLLQLKDPLKLIIMPKSTFQGSDKPLISQTLWPRKGTKHTSDPMHKFVNELQRDLELVYVGQVCLSWEILCWQHKKAQELQQYDSPWPRRYNIVAGEFQLFQVLVHRFVENEPFQGPRIQNYVKNRRAIRNLLHVPAIKDDNMKDKKITKGGGEDAIAGGRLVEIIKESMQVFWEFVRADKDYGNVILKVSNKIGNNDDVIDPEFSDLLVDIKAQLHKKERKLKDIVRSGNCIVRKFQKQNEGQVKLDHEQLLAQVGLRLISRVVNMKKLRKDQLVWCNEKLNRINFVGRKIRVEPSFLLFPC